jgi:predicted metal-binding membrane protein
MTPPPGALERVLARDRRLVAIALAVLALLAWGYLVMLAQRMGPGEILTSPTSSQSMPGMPGMPEMPGMEQPAVMTLDSGPWMFGLTALMWWVMMIGMMVPSATPMILLFGNVQRRQLATESPALRVALFTAGYLIAWGLFSMLAAGAQMALTRLALLAPMELTVTTAWVGAAFVAAAGVYQLTPLKNACLRRCRSPAEFLSSHWRRGNSGAVRMGIEHGGYCVGCCWLLMGLLFAVGVMNLLWVVAIAAFVLVEKLAPRGEAIARLSGTALLLFAGYLLLGI